MSDKATRGIEDLGKDAEVFVHQFVMKQLDSNEVLATSNKLPEDEFSSQDLQHKLLPPPYDAFKLSLLTESSSILGPAIGVMEVNVDSFGVEFVPSVDDETFKELEEEQEKLLGSRPKDTGTKTDKPNRQETEIEAEYRRAVNFFKYCNRRLSYTQLRKRLRRDFEQTGNGYYEILRNHLTGKITGIEWLPSHTVRIGKMEKFFVDYMAKRKVSDTEIEEFPDKQKFRRFAQIKEAGSKPVWYKEFWDPRLMDADTGAMATAVRNEKGTITKVIPINDSDFPAFDVNKLLAGRMKLATEILHFMCYQTARSLPYGIPRWIGNLISIIGSRSSEEINLMYFDNKTVPPGMLLVEGGKITKDTTERITNHIKDNVKGSKNFHSILLVEATARENPNPNLPAPGVPRLKWISMRDAQNGDALFQKYDQQNIDKIIGSFRYWGGYVGRTKEINLATAQVARQISEEQVFQPEREEYDSIINRTIMVDMNFNYWEHKTKGPQLSTPKEKADILKSLEPYITGKEGRLISGEILNKELEELPEGSTWQDKPLRLVIAELSKLGNLMTGGVEGEGTGTEKTPFDEEGVEKKPPGVESVEKFASKLIAVRKALAQAEAKAATKEMRGD